MSTATASDLDEIYYYVELSVKSSRVQVLVNGMPVYRKAVPVTSSFQSPTNDLLVGEGNRIEIQVQPTVTSDGTPSTLSEMHVGGTIKRYGPSDEYSTPEGGKVLTTFDLHEELDRRREALQEQFNEQLEAASPQEKAELMEKQAEMITPTPPITMEVTFDSKDLPSFANRFVEGPVIEDTTRLIDYGVRLRDLLREREAREFYQDHYAIKDDDYNRAYPWDYKEDGSWFIDGELKEAIFPNGPMLDFEREDIGVRKWCDGRVWELYVKDGTPFGRPFIKTKGLEGEISTIVIYVAEVDGELTIIR